MEFVITHVGYTEVVVLRMDAMVSICASVCWNICLQTSLFMVVPLSQFPNSF
jgi:hypothetical protein